MPGNLSELVKSLLKSPEGVLPSVQAFPPLDIDQIASAIRIEARGSENGKRNLPATDSQVEDSVEGDILAEIERRARKAGEEHSSQLDLYEGRIRRALAAVDQRASIEAAGESALTDFRIQAIDDLDHLYTARTEVEGREREFEAFRTANGLVRLPTMISARERKFRWLLLAILVASESALNGVLFAGGSEAGIIGGVVQAFFLSVLNIGVAVLYAWFLFPFAVHVRWNYKLLGWCGVVLYALWALGINLFIGHFRDLFIHNAGQVTVAELLARLTTAPLRLDDAKSLILVLVGILMSIVSLIDAVGMKDRYLQYEAIGRRRAEALAAYADDKARCLAGLTIRRDSALREMSAVIESIRAAEYELRLASEGRERLNRNYRAFLSHLGDCHVRLLQQYREANTPFRSTPAPARFQRRPELAPFLSETPEERVPDLGKSERARVIERMEYFIKAINQQFEIEVNNYQTIARLTRLDNPQHVNA